MRRLTTGGFRSGWSNWRLFPVVAGLVPATPIILALCLSVRGRRDKPGDDGGE